ncbi:MAG: alpha/beta hydrolase [Qingshengfaniella sp.]
MPSPEFIKLYKAMAAQPRVPATDAERLDGLMAMRLGMEKGAARNALPEGLAVAPVDGAPLPAECLMPRGAREGRVILYLHGGAFALGSIASHRHVAAWLAEAAGCPVIIADYPLAPEHPFPAAVEGVADLYRWLVGQGAPVALAGDSAGANLALVTAMAAQTTPVAIATLSPTVDVGAFFRDRGGNADPSLDEAMIAWAFGLYLGATDPADPRVSPMEGALGRLPPTFVQYAEAEVFAPAARRFVDRMQAAGVLVEQDIWPDMVHAWHWFAPRLPEARDALARAGAFLSAAFDRLDEEERTPWKPQSFPAVRKASD